MTISKDNESTVEVEQLRDDFVYEPDTGLLLHARRKGRGGSLVFPGDEAGGISVRGYRVIRINKVLFFAHRVCWAAYFGAWPDGEIDHLNQNKLDNRVANLRIATPSENSRNGKIRSDNTTGVRGVSPHKGKLAVQMVVDGKNRRFGTFDNIEDAALVRRVAESELWGGPHRLGPEVVNQ